MRACAPHVVLLPSLYPSLYCPLDGIYIQEQACALRAAGVRVGVVYPELRSWRTLHDGHLSKSLFQTTTSSEHGIDTVRNRGWNVPFFGLRPRVWRFLALRSFAKYIKHFGKPDLCHAHSAIWAGAAASEVKKRFGIPYVLTEHSSAYRRNLFHAREEEATQKALGDASRVITVSKSLRADIQRYAPNQDIMVIPNLVDADFFTIPEISPVRKTFRFLTVALLTKVKGVDLLIQAFHTAFSEHPDVELEIAGEGPERQNLEELARTLRISDRVHFSGLLSKEQVRESMWRSNAFVLASHTETFGLVLAEALATGLPVVATRCGGPEDFVNEEVGFLVQPGSVPELTQALKQLWAESTKFDRSKLREYARQKFSAPVVSQQICDIYRRVLCHPA